MSNMLLVLLGVVIGGLVVAAVASWAVWKYIIIIIIIIIIPLTKGIGKM